MLFSCSLSSRLSEYKITVKPCDRMYWKLVSSISDGCCWGFFIHSLGFVHQKPQLSFLLLLSVHWIFSSFCLLRLIIIVIRSNIYRWKASRMWCIRYEQKGVLIYFGAWYLSALLIFPWRCWDGSSDQEAMPPQDWHRSCLQCWSEYLHLKCAAVISAIMDLRRMSFPLSS